MNLVFHELTHFIDSLLIGFFVWKITRRKKPFPIFISALIGGFFIDIDHFFDYFLAFGPKFSSAEFFSGKQFRTINKIILPLHSWELVIFMLIILIVLNFAKFKKYITLRTCLLAFSLALGLHLIIDTAQNEMPPESYFLIRRIQTNFNIEHLTYPTSPTPSLR